jgi:hypothetical protein
VRAGLEARSLATISLFADRRHDSASRLSPVAALPDSLIQVISSLRR